MCVELARASVSLCAPGKNESPVAAAQRTKPLSLHLPRLFAFFATLILLMTAFAVLPRPVSADTTLSSSSPTPIPSTVYAPGLVLSSMNNGQLQASNIPTFTRWDGTVAPYATLNFTAGQWPYMIRQNSTSFTATRGVWGFTQAKVPGANYTFEVNRIKETLEVQSAPATPLLTSTISIPFATNYTVYVQGTTVQLAQGTAAVAWSTGPFEAWDSGQPTQTWSNPVTSVAVSMGVLVLTLNATMLASATYPLYVDPTWTLSAAAGWGASTFENATIDPGDGTVKIGYLAHDFNDNVNPGWSVSQGTATFSSGTMNLAACTQAATGAGWSNLNAQFSLIFSSSKVTGGDTLFFRFGGNFFNNANSLSIIGGTTNNVYLEMNSGYTVTISESVKSNTLYLVRVVAEANYYELYWNGVRVIAASDPTPSQNFPTGGIGFYDGCQVTTSIDNVRVWNTNAGTITAPIRDAGTSIPTQTEVFGTQDTYNQFHLQIRNSIDNKLWGPWTNLKANAAASIPYAAPNQTQTEFYQLRVTLTTGVNATPILTQVTTMEGSQTITPSANTGSEPWYPYVGGMVNLVTGNLYLSSSDFAFQGKGLSVGVSRSYNSLLASSAGPFGLGWSFNYGQSLTINTNGNVTWSGPDGSQFLFVAKGSTGGFDSPRGAPERLIKNSDGTYALWMTDGSQMKFSSTGTFQSISDRNGNVVTLTYSGAKNPLLTSVTDGSGRSMTFTYDSSNRIQTVTDPMQRRVLYSYASGANVLLTVTDPTGAVTTYGYNSGNELTTFRDPVGKQTLVNYVSGGQVASIYLQNVTTSGSVVWQFREYTVTYNSTTKRAVQDPRGFWTTVILNAFGNAVVVSGPSIGCSCDSSGNVSYSTWDGEMNRIGTTDGRRNAWSTAYGFRGNLLNTTDPGGNVSSTGWLEANNATTYVVVRTSSITARGFSTVYGYDSKGNLLSMTDPGGNTTRYAYDASGFLNRTVSARGFTSWYVYNVSGDLVKREDNLSETTTYSYDILGRQTSVTDPMGFVTTTAYDKDGRVTKTTDAMGNTTTYHYDLRGDLIQTTDRNGLTTTYTVNVTDARDSLINDPGGNLTRYAYDLANNLVSVTDARSHTTSRTYDSFNRLLTSVTPLQHTTRNVYDAAGNVLATTDPSGNTIRYLYDRSERLAATLFPNGTAVTMSYDLDGNVHERKGRDLDELYTYDALDRTFAVQETFLTATLATTVGYRFDADGNQVSETGNGAQTSSYNANGQVLWRKDASLRQWTYTYNPDGLVSKETYPDGTYVTYAYDKDTRVVNETTWRSDGTILESYVYAYDAVGNRLQVKQFFLYEGDFSSALGTCNQSVNTCDQKTASTLAAGLSPTPQGIRIYVRVNGTSFCNPPQCPVGSVGQSTLTVYLDTVHNGVTTRTSIGSTTVHGWFDLTYSTAASLFSGDSAYGEVSYTVVCTGTGGLCSPVEGIIVDQMSHWYAAKSVAQTNTYTKQYRLSQAVYASGALESFTYDAVGNRASRTYAGSTTTYAYDNDDRLTSSSDGTTYTYDANGNELTKTNGAITTSYGYDVQNELTSVAQTFHADAQSACGGTGTMCTADANPVGLAPNPETVSVSLRAAGTVSLLSGGATMAWDYVLNGVATSIGSMGCTQTCGFDQTFTASVALHSGDTLYGEFTWSTGSNIVMHLTLVHLSYAPTTTATAAYGYSGDGMRTTTVSGNGAAQHDTYDVSGQNGLPQVTGEYSGSSLVSQNVYDRGTDAPVERSSGASVDYLHTDGLGSVTSITDPSQNVASAFRYDAYGNPTESADYASDPYRYTSQAWDSGPGLVHDGARAYDPSTGRFLSTDPAGSAGASAYAYAGDNPTSFSDPSGRVRGQCAPNCGDPNPPSGCWVSGTCGSATPVIPITPGVSGTCSALRIAIVLSVVALVLSAVIGVPLLGEETIGGFLGTEATIHVTFLVGALTGAIGVGNAGLAAETLLEIFVYIALAYAAQAGFIAALGIAADLLTPELFVVVLLVQLALLLPLLFDFSQNGCTW